MVTLLGDRSPDHSAHQSFYRATGLGINPDRLGQRAAIASELQLAVVILYLYRAAQVIQNEGSRTGCCDGPKKYVATATDMNTRPIENITWSRWLAL